MAVRVATVSIARPPFNPRYRAIVGLPALMERTAGAVDVAVALIDGPVAIDHPDLASGNVRVLNDTADYYRFFDATPHAEFLYACVQRTIDEELPRETDFLRRYDHFRKQVQNIADMPDATVDLLFRFLQQNEGKTFPSRP